MRLGKKTVPSGSFLSNAWTRIYDATMTAAITSLTIDGINDNQLINSNFERWSAGASAAPDGWTFSGSAVAREGTTKKIEQL